MIIDHLNALPLAGLPPRLRDILASPDCHLSALLARDDGRWQPEGAAWFCTLGPAQTQPAESRHTEYHHQWADIQVVLEGEECIHAGSQPVARAGDEQRKPDLYISETAHSRIKRCAR